jgi:hypothetical protein
MGQGKNRKKHVYERKTPAQTARLKNRERGKVIVREWSESGKNRIENTIRRR